jgi:hypothetical protein
LTIEPFIAILGAMHLHQHTDISQMLYHTFIHSLEITLFVFLMMVVVDYLNVWTKGRLTSILKVKHSSQYILSSALGTIPGCLGSFLVVTLFIRGMLSFGSTVGCFLAASGDAAFVMLAKIPDTALLLFSVLFVAGVVFGKVSDLVADKLQITTNAECQEDSHHLSEPDCRIWPRKIVFSNLSYFHPLRITLIFVVLFALIAVTTGLVGPETFNWIRVAIIVLLAVGLFVVVTVPNHYVSDHIGKHIIQHHLFKIFLWTAGTLLVLGLLQHFFEIHEIISGHMIWVLVLAALIGVIPDSGPHLIFVFLFANGAVPFSVLLTSSMVQDGHGLLPLLSVSVRDSIKIKLFNLVIGLLVGLSVYLLGY